MHIIRRAPRLLAAVIFTALAAFSACSVAASATPTQQSQRTIQSASERALFNTARQLAAGDLHAASAELQRAERALRSDALTNDHIARVEATRLLRDAHQLQHHIRQGDADSHRLALTLWRKSAALAERRAAYLGDAWPRVMHDHPVKSQLIDARLYLHYAEIAAFTAHNPSAVDEYLSRAQTHVSRAHEIAFKLQRPVMEIVGVQKHIAALAAARPAQRTPEQFRLRRGELSVMIDQ